MLHGNMRAYHQNQHPAMDYITDAGRVITNNMGAIHHRQCFSSHMALEELESGNYWDVLFQTPSDYYIHLKFINVWLSWGFGALQIWEDIEEYTGGWVVDMFNRYRAPLTPTTTPAPTTTVTTTTGTTTTGTTTTATTTTATTSTTEAPHTYPVDSQLDFRFTWAEEFRHMYDSTEAQNQAQIGHPGTTNVVIREGGIATLGNAVEIDAYRFVGLLRLTADEWFDHEWVLRKNKKYLFRFYRITGIPYATTTLAPTTSTTAAPPL